MHAVEPPAGKRSEAGAGRGADVPEDATLGERRQPQKAAQRVISFL